MNHITKTVLMGALLFCCPLLCTLGCSDDAAYETSNDNADSDTSKQNGNDSGKQNGNDTEKQNGNDSGKQNDSDTDKQGESDSSKQDDSESDSDNGPDTESDTQETPPGAETWVDETTGLEWQVTPPEQSLDSWDAMKYCEGLDLAGQQDWRLPTLSEMRSIIRGCPATETGGECPITTECIESDDPYACYSDHLAPEVLSCYTGCPKLEAGACYWPSQLRGTCSVYWSTPAKSNTDYFNCVKFYSAAIDGAHSSENHEYWVRCVWSSPVLVDRSLMLLSQRCCKAFHTQPG